MHSAVHSVDVMAEWRVGSLVGKLIAKMVDQLVRCSAVPWEVRVVEAWALQTAAWMVGSMVGLLAPMKAGHLAVH